MEKLFHADDSLSLSRSERLSLFEELLLNVCGVPNEFSALRVANSLSLLGFHVSTI